MSKRPTYDPDNDYYALLGVPPTATYEQIQRAYRQRAKETHPDTNPDRRDWATHTFKQLTEAYAVLGDPESRAQYNEQRWLHLTPDAGRSAGRQPRYATYQDFPWPQKMPRRRRVSVGPGPWIALLFLLSAVFCVGGLLAIDGPWRPAVLEAPSGLPALQMLDDAPGCAGARWRIERLVLEVGPEHAPVAVRAYGSAGVETYVLILSHADLEAPAQSGPMLGPVADGFLARVAVPDWRNATYSLALRALSEARTDCVVTFEIK